MTLSDFEKIIDPKILKRGYDYWFTGQITDLLEKLEGHWQAKVSGTSTYHVEVKVKNDVVTQISCNCPYDYGDECKHMVAVLYGIREGLSRDKFSSLSPPKSRKELTEEILQDVSTEDLLSFVKSQAIQNKEFFLYLLAEFGQKLDFKELKTHYKRFIEELFKEYARKDHYINYEDVFAFIPHIDALLAKAGELILNYQYKTAMAICQACAEDLIFVIMDADDSQGYIGDSIKDAFDMLIEITQESSDEEIKKEMSLFCEKEKEKNRHHYEAYGFVDHFDRLVSLFDV